MDKDSIKDFYKRYDDRISVKRWKSKYPLRSYAHEMQYQGVLRHVEKGMKVLDAGCGDGVLSYMMAERGALVTGVDLSVPNIASAESRNSGSGQMVKFILGDVESLPFPDNSFDLVVSSHVLEHLPDFDRGLREIMRVTKRGAVVAIPTVCNLCSLVQVGRGWFWLKGLRSFLALPWGACQMIWAYISGAEGVNETYGGEGAPHIFRFVRNMKKRIKDNRFVLVSYEASSICLPYFTFLLPLIKFMDKYRDKPLLRNCGYGTTFTIEKSN